MMRAKRPPKCTITVAGIAITTIVGIIAVTGAAGKRVK
jgi:hypothetical protein